MGQGMFYSDIFINYLNDWLISKLLMTNFLLTYYCISTT